MKESSEHYLETILILSEKIEKVRAIDIVKATGFSKPSISVALKKLRASGHIDIGTSGEILLTGLGRSLANDILLRHKVIMETLISFGISENIADEDACKIEHVISQETFAKMQEYVNNLK